MANIIEIKSINLPELEVYYNLNEKQLFRLNEPEAGIFIAESPMVVERALEKGCMPVSFLLDKKILNDKVKEMLAHFDVPAYAGDDEVLCSITGFHLTRGILCAMQRPPEEDIDKILAASSRIAVLENVMNPTNMGALFRSAAALGIDAVLVTEGGCDPLYRRCVRVSMGTVFQLPWAYLPKDRNTADFLRQMGFKTAAMALRKNSVSLEDEKLNSEGKLAVVLGSEGPGLNESTIDSCDYTVMIPMSHGVDSLNVAAAAAVAFYRLGMKDKR